MTLNTKKITAFGLLEYIKVKALRQNLVENDNELKFDMEGGGNS